MVGIIIIDEFISPKRFYPLRTFLNPTSNKRALSEVFSLSYSEESFLFSFALFGSVATMFWQVTQLMRGYFMNNASLVCCLRASLSADSQLGE